MADGLNGIINLDKPAGISSARAVGVVKRLIPRGTKIGHAGTLDPFATGVLLLLIGKATKSCEKLMDAPKQYEATIGFGATTATDDPESLPVPWQRAEGGELQAIERDHIETALAAFVGKILQRPPAFSALKIGGRPAYKLARMGAPVEMKHRPVRVYSIEVLAYEWPTVRVRIDCGRGTYIRAIARDLGEVLNVGGYLTELRRTAVGGFRTDDALSIEDLGRDGVEPHLRAVP